MNCLETGFRRLLAVMIFLGVSVFAALVNRGNVRLLKKYAEPYLEVQADRVNPDHEGKRVQIKARAYTEDWLELPALGVRCQALRLDMQVTPRIATCVYMGLPLSDAATQARHARMGAFNLEISSDGGFYAEYAPLPLAEIKVPERWRAHCRVDDGLPDELALVLADEPPRRVSCSVIENGRELVVRGIQRGQCIAPVHILANEELVRLFDRQELEDDWRSVVTGQLVLWGIPALLLGAFRLLRWEKAGKHAALAIWMMLALDAVTFLCCGGWAYVAWAGGAGAVLVFFIWRIVRIIRSFSVDAEAR